ncbi:DUF4129 domain-containing protein [Flavobacterium sp. GT3R68]|uniref:DUF4129 domain-containing protein n=1 Tax=Flavobacterium sp. GT3R68 TaxID=2594437 RepID=UPI000F887FCE|nr:DUF4129 domain-containing protein [Flavobacterium sp. GT3R68]RTY92359.1 DUF4129 domain-containing protein [Flavobacterium sp. GSN2]TRW92273.1 DUF4129 domain-containing protein [Flavobacterium sp. GT3R68]
MNRLLIILLFFCYSHIDAQDTLATAKNEITTQVNVIAIDTSGIELQSFPKDFKKKYTDSAFIYEYKTPEKNAWDRFKEWLANIIRSIFNLGSDHISMGFVEILLKVIAGLIVIFVIYLIVKAILNKEGKWIFSRNSKKLINYDEIEKNLHLVDFEKLIAKTLQSGERRLSIRYYYLWLLKKMAEKHLIVWDIEKTNSDYLYEINSQAKKDEFAYLSYLYNYIWYGEFDMDEETFTKAKKSFESSIKLLSNE